MRKLLLSLILPLAVVLAPKPVMADSTPPAAQAELQGTLGQNDWYTSTLNVNLSATDTESGVASITYELDANPPVVTEFQSGDNAVQNPSFETGYFWGIQKWSRRIEAGWGWFWQSFLISHTGSRSASIIDFFNGTGYWHNRNSDIWVEPGQSYTASVWAKTYIYAEDSHVMLEVWQKTGSWSSDVLLASSQHLAGVSDWTQLSTSFTPQAGQDRVYLRLRLTAGGFLALAYFDDATLLSVTPPVVGFNVSENGEHSLGYWAQDAAGNESQRQDEAFNIDTSAPAGWQNFGFTSGSSSNVFSGNIELIDAVSGVDVSEAEYAYYTELENQGWDHNGDGETDWYSVASVTRVLDGAPAGDGEVTQVSIETPEVDFGESSVYRFLFRASDMSGQSSQSAVQTIEGPWVKALDTDVYAAGGIVMYLPAPGAESNSAGMVGSGDSITNFSSQLGASVAHYSEAHTQGGLLSWLPDYNLLKSKALPPAGGKTPDQDGLYLFDGDFVLDEQSKTTGFESNTLVAVIFVEGNMRVRTNVVLNGSSVVLWVVEGDLLIEGVVEDLGGLFLSGGDCDTNVDRVGQNQLRLSGTLACMGKVTLARDLGEDGPLRNSTDPAEDLRFDAKVLLDDRLAQVLNQGENEYTFIQK